MIYLTIIAFVVVLGLVIFVHEFGHFIVAKLSGVKVEEFAFGFPPKIFCIKKGETRYCINAIPFGGYVKMLGEEKNDKSPRSFSSKKPWKKISIIVAGVIMNYILACFLLSAGYMIGMPPISLKAENFGYQKNNVTVLQVKDGYPAAQSGLQKGDQILGFENADEFSNYTKSNVGNVINLKIKRGSQESTKIIQLSSDQSSPLGVATTNLTLVQLPFFKAIGAGFTDATLTTGNVFIALKNFVVQLFQGNKEVAKEVSGPIGIFKVTGEAVKMGFVYIIQLAALISINLGIINILPIPALDGGRAVILIAEAIAGRKVIKEEIENWMHTVGFVLLILLIIAVTLKDIIV